MAFNDRLREAMISRDISQAELVRRSGINKGTISNYLHGKYEPKQQAIYTLAKALNINEAWLMGLDVPMNRVVKTESVSYKVPLYSDVSCGTGLFVDDHVDEYLTVPSKYLTPNKEYFAMTAKGDSMIEKGIVDGDVLVFEKDSTLSNGQIGCFCIDENEAVCKIFRRTNEGFVLLMSANENYEPIVVDVTKTCFKVLGKLRVKFSKVE